MADDNVVSVKYKVDIAEAKSANDSFIASMKSSLDQITSQLSAIRGASNQTSGAIIQMANDSKNGMDSLKQSFEQSSKDIVDAIEKTKTSLSFSGGSHKKHAEAVGANSTAIRESIVVMRELGRGDLTRLPGSLSILAQQFDFTRSIISGLISPIGVLIAGLSGIAYISYKSDESQRKVSNALELSGNSAGLTSDSFYKLSDSVATFSKISNSQAKSALLEIAKQGFLTKQGMNDLAESAILLGRKTGEGTDEALKYLLKMKDGATKAAISIVKDGYNLLTAAQIEEIRHLENIGEAEKAQELLAADVKKSLIGMADGANQATSGIRALGVEFSNFIGYIGRFISGAETATEKIYDLRGELSAAKSINNVFGNLFDTKSLQKQITDIQATENKKIETAKKGAEETRKQRAIIEDDEWASHFKKNDQRLSEELQHLKKYAAEKNLTIKQQHEIEEQIRSRYEFHDKKPKKPTGQVTESQIVKRDLQEMLVLKEQSAIDEHRIYTERLQDTLKFYEAEEAAMKLKKGVKPRDIQAIDNQRLAAKLALAKQEQTQLVQSEEDIIRDTTLSYEKRIEMTKTLEQQLFNAKLKTQDSRYYEVVNKKHKLIEDETKKHAKIMQEQLSEIGKQEREFSLENLEDQMSIEKIKLINHKISDQKYLDEMKDFIKQKYEIKRNELKLDLMSDDPKKSGKARTDWSKLGRQEAKEQSKIQQESAKESQKAWDDFGSGVKSTIRSNIKEMLTGHETLAQGMRGIFNGILESGVNAFEGIAEKWALTAIFGETVTGTGARLDVASNAAVAGSAAFASTAAIPIIGPGLAPEAASAAYLSTMAFQSLIPSAEGGWDIPANTTGFMRYHEQEMMLPKAEANVVRGMAKKSNNTESSGGDVHHHYSPVFNVSAIDASGVKQWVDNNIKTIAKSLMNHSRSMS